MNDVEHLLHRTIAVISQSDPLIKLLEQVRLGRMTRSDPGLRVITDTWVATYRKAVATPGLTKQALRRIDPSPRLDLLAQEGLLPVDHAAARELLADLQPALSRAAARLCSRFSHVRTRDIVGHHLSVHGRRVERRAWRLQPTSVSGPR